MTLTLGSQPHQNRLAAKLKQLGMLRRVISFGLELEILDPTGAGDLKLVRRFRSFRIGNRILWGLWRRTPGSKYSRNFPVAIATPVGDWIASRWVPPSTIFHGWSALCLTGMRVAKRGGAVTLIENAILHPTAWQRAVVEECNAFGVRPRDCRAILPSALIRRMEREYEICDYIIVPSAIARQSFVEAGLGEKTIVVHAGVDHNFFSPPMTPAEREVFRVCYVGRIELAKGVPYLLQAWSRLGIANAELVLIGDVSPEMRPLIERYGGPNVRFTGLLSPERVADHYRNSNLFVFPSVNEGLARVLLEAMASGLPVIATEESGARDCVSPGVDGTIVRARDVDALCEAMLWHYRNPEVTAEMGKAARKKIKERFTLSHFEDRMVAIYRQVDGERPASARP